MKGSFFFLDSETPWWKGLSEKVDKNVQLNKVCCNITLHDYIYNKVPDLLIVTLPNTYLILIMY